MKTHILKVWDIEFQIIEKEGLYFLPFHEVCKIAGKGTATDKKRIAYNIDFQPEKINGLIYYPAIELAKNEEIKNTCSILSELFKVNQLAERLGIDNERMEGELEGLSSTCSGLIATKEGLEREKNALDIELDSVKESRNQFQTSYNDLKKMNTINIDQLGDTEERLEVLSDCFFESQKEVLRLENICQKSDFNYNELEKKTGEALDNLDYVNSELINYRDDNIRLNSLHDILESDYNKLQASYKVSISQCEGLQNGINELESDVLDFDKALGTATVYANELENEVSGLMEKVEELQASYKRLKIISGKPKTVKALLQRLGSFLISPELGFLTFLFVLLVQVYHNARLFHMSEVSENWLIAILYAIGVDLFALVLTVHFNNKSTLKYFAFAQFALNILYYRFWMHHATATPMAIWEGLSTTLISALLAFVIYSYGELFVKIIAQHIKAVQT
jgi:prefoldin subunit 5